MLVLIVNTVTNRSIIISFACFVISKPTVWLWLRYKYVLCYVNANEYINSVVVHICDKLLTVVMLLTQGKATIDLPCKDHHTAMMSGLITCKASVTELLIQHGQSPLCLSVSLCPSVCECLFVCRWCSSDYRSTKSGSFTFGRNQK